MPLTKPFSVAAHVAAELGVERDGVVEVLGRAHAVRERGDRGDRPLAQHEVVVDELLGGAQVDRLVVLFGHVQAEDVDVEDARGRQVGDDEFHVRAAQDVGGCCGRRRDRVVGPDGSLLRHVVARGGQRLRSLVGHVSVLACAPVAKRPAFRLSFRAFSRREGWYEVSSCRRSGCGTGPPSVMCTLCWSV